MSHIKKGSICLVSGHYPDVVLFAELTRNLLKIYAKNQGYGFYYDSITPVPLEVPELHFRRCLVLVKAREAFPNAEWYVWIDTDIYVQDINKRIEDFIDLEQPNILYHLFNEKPWTYPVNTGIKIINQSVISVEEEIYEMRHGVPHPFEQKVVIDYILPKYKDQVVIHDPYELNCIYGKHDTSKALFVHVCSRSEVNRNLIILSNTKKLYAQEPEIINNKYYKNFKRYFLVNYGLKIMQTAQRFIGLKK